MKILFLIFRINQRKNRDRIRVILSYTHCFNYLLNSSFNYSYISIFFFRKTSFSYYHFIFIFLYLFFLFYCLVEMETVQLSLSVIPSKQAYSCTSDGRNLRIIRNLQISSINLSKYKKDVITVIQ